MKVLLLNGSANKKGNTFTALTEIANQLEKNGIEYEIVQLGNKPVRGCIACGQCRAKQLGRCIFDDDVCNRIVEKLNEADALIVGSPVYYGQPNGAVMAVLQRAFFVLLFLFPRKTSTEITIAVVVWIDNNLLNDNLRVYHDNFQRMFPWGSTKRRIEPAQIIKHFVTAELLPAIYKTT